MIAGYEEGIGALNPLSLHLCDLLCTLKANGTSLSVFGIQGTHLDIFVAISIHLLRAKDDATLSILNNTPIGPHTTARCQIDSEQAERSSSMNILGQRITGQRHCIDLNCLLIQRLEKSRVAREQGGPDSALAIYAAHNHHLLIAQEFLRNRRNRGANAAIDARCFALHTRPSLHRQLSLMILCCHDASHLLK